MFNFYKFWISLPQWFAFFGFIKGYLSMENSQWKTRPSSLASIAAVSFLWSVGIVHGIKRFSGKRDRCTHKTQTFRFKKK